MSTTYEGSDGRKFLIEECLSGIRIRQWGPDKTWDDPADACIYMYFDEAKEILKKVISMLR